jgi:hypothetical protein
MYMLAAGPTCIIPELFVPVQALKLFDNVGAIVALWLNV